MPQLTPDVQPLAVDKTLKVDSGVTVGVSYADVGSNDRVQMYWGVAPGQTASITASTPSKLFSIPKNQICDGSLTVWFSAQDAIGNKGISAAPTIIIDTGFQLLLAPTAAAQDTQQPELGFVIKVPANPDFGLVLQAKDSVTVYWDIYDAATNALIATHNSNPFVLTTAAPNGYSTPPLTPAPTSSEYAAIRYEATRIITAADGDNDDPVSTQMFRSFSCQVAYGDLWPVEISLPAPTFPEAVAGVLDVTLLAGSGASLAIPATSAISNTTVEFTGNGYATGSSSPIAGAHWDSGDVTVFSTPYTDTKAIPNTALSAVPSDGHYTVYYTVNGHTSPSATVTIARQTHPTGDTYPAPFFPEAQSGKLNIGPLKSQDQIFVQASSTAISGKIIYFFGSGFTIDGQNIANTSWSSGPVPGNPRETVVSIPLKYFTPVPDGGIYTVYYRVDDPTVGDSSKSDSVIVIRTW